MRTGEDGKRTKLYYHKVVEAKVVFSETVILSLGTEFIENEKEDASKQDCEINAAKRLLKKIKKDYPRLPICVQGDVLYATEPLSVYTDIGYPDAALSGMESIYQGVEADHKKYIFRAAGKFLGTNSNG